MSCSVHDVAEFESQAIPSVFVASDEFTSARTAQAAALGIDPAAVWVAHPIQDRTDAEIESLADQAFDQVVAALIA